MLVNCSLLEADLEHQMPALPSHIQYVLFCIVCNAIADVITMIIANFFASLLYNRPFS